MVFLIWCHSEFYSHYKCIEIGLEELTMGATDNGKGTWFNKLCNNEWNRTDFQWIIKKLSDKHHIACKLVNCAYSSYIGNILHVELPDPCAAAWEIARRARHQYIAGLCMYPEVDFTNMATLDRWKNTKVDFAKVKTWKDLCKQIKNLGLKYRVQLDLSNVAVSDFQCKKSGIVIYSNFFN